MFDEAVAELQKSIELSGCNPEYMAALARGYTAAGQRRNAQEILQQLRKRAEEEYVPAYAIARVLGGLGEITEAFDWLDQAYSEQHYRLVLTKVDPRLTPSATTPASNPSSAA